MVNYVNTDLAQAHMQTAYQTSLASLSLTAITMPSGKSQLTLWNLGSSNIHVGGADLIASAPYIGVVLPPSATVPFQRKSLPTTKIYIICGAATTYKVLYE